MSRSTASRSPFVFTAMSWSSPRNWPLVSNGTGCDHVLPPSYECHSSGPFESPMAPT